MNRSKRACINHPDNFCYICGRFTPRDQCKNRASKVKTAYHHYFGVKVGDQDKWWAPHIFRTVCSTGLTQWLRGKRKAMSFSVPMIWREPKNHLSDCYFCLTKISGFSKKNKSKITYPDCESALKPVPHDGDNPVPIPPTTSYVESDDNSAASVEIEGADGGQDVYEPNDEESSLTY